MSALERRAANHFLAGRWRAGYALMGGWFMPKHQRVGTAVAWLLGPYLGGRPKDLRVLRLDADADDGFDATDALSGITCPTLVVSGGLDLAYPPDLIRELVAGLPDVRHIEYPEAGHRGDRRFAEDACSFLAGSASAESGASTSRSVPSRSAGTPR